MEVFIQLKGRVAIVTDGGNSIGKAISLAVFLASEQSSAITGQTINIDAGANFN